MNRFLKTSKRTRMCNLALRRIQSTDNPLFLLSSTVYLKLELAVTVICFAEPVLHLSEAEDRFEEGVNKAFCGIHPGATSYQCLA